MKFEHLGTLSTMFWLYVRNCVSWQLNQMQIFKRMLLWIVIVS